MTEALPQDSGAARERARLIHRENQQLILLIAVAILAFFATRTMAAHNRAMRRQDAIEWYGRGDQALRERRVDDAVEMFRHAAVRDPLSISYKLALARALGEDHQTSAASEVLLALRELEPESPDVNIELARLSARRGDDASATVRYYQAALNALWRPGDRAPRRTLRLELIRFLIDRGQPVRAVPEMLTLSTNLPPEAAWKTRVGLLLMEAGEYRRALDLFGDALALDPSDRDARAGASRARALIAVTPAASQ